MSDWLPWQHFHTREPLLGMYVQVEVECHICSEPCMLVEMIWGLDDSERIIREDKNPCIPTFERWRQRAPDVKIKQRKKENA